jgi:hypothetical protein
MPVGIFVIAAECSGTANSATRGAGSTHPIQRDCKAASAPPAPT